MDLRYPSDDSVIHTSKDIENFHYNFKRKLERQSIAGGHKVDPRFITVEEEHNNQHPHYHTVLLVNANAKNKAYSILQEAEKQWKQVLHTDHQGLVNYCNEKGENGIIIDRNKEDFEEKKNQCSHQASYLAKVREKDKQAKGSWTVKGTRTPKRSS